MPNRVSGLSGTGIDVDQMVKDAMKAQRAKYDKLGQTKTQLEWKKTDYNTMYTAINDFRSKTMLPNKLQSTLMPKQVSSSDDTKVTMTANADAVNFVHAINVTDLAQNASMTSSGTITTAGSTGKTNLNDHIGVTGKIKLTLSDGTTTRDLSNTTDGSGYDTTGKSIYDVVSDINKLGLNVKASYDATLDRFFLSNSKPGAASQVTLTSSDGTGTGAGSLAEKLKLSSSAVVTTDAVIPGNQPPVFTTGKDAKFDLDGVVGLTQTSNQFVISGISYNLKATGSAKATVSPDIEKTVANVKNFIDAYNTMLAKVNTEVNEDKFKNFLPLTDEQKQAMKDTDIKLWEDKAKSGSLRRDPILQQLADKMRNDVATPIAGLTGKYTSASNIGITTGSWQEGGKLYLSESKLREALTADPEVVNKIFGSGVSNTQGIAVRMTDTLKAASDKIVTEAGISASATFDTKSSMGKQINDYDKRMSDMNTRLTDMENSYYTKFAAMDTALAKMNKQSTWLAQQVGAK